MTPQLKQHLDKMLLDAIDQLLVMRAKGQITPEFCIDQIKSAIAAHERRIQHG